RFDLEDQPARSITPSRFGNVAPVVVMHRRGSEYGERAIAVVTLEATGGVIQSGTVQTSFDRQLMADTKRRMGLVVGAHIITVSTADGAVPRVELVSHFERARHPDVGWQHSVHRAA